MLLCEDTRSPVRLLGDRVELPPRRSCFVGNEHERVAEMLTVLEAGGTVAFVSEAGMPCWSDPGAILVRAALAAGFVVDVVPGPTAVATALCHSGLSADDVRFRGFVPRGGQERREWVADVVWEKSTLVCYEAGNRVPALLADLAAGLPDAATRRMCIARELTKLHQELLYGTVAELAAKVQAPLIGEVTIVIAPGPPRSDDPVVACGRAVAEAFLAAGLRPRERARRLAELTGWPAREIYARLSGRGDGDEG